MENEFYKKMIEAAPMGYALQKVVFNADGKAIDYEFVDANNAFEKFLGLSGSEIIGRKATEVLPVYSKSILNEIEIFCDIGVSGGKKEIEVFSENTQQWYKLVVFSFEKNSFVTLICFAGDVLSEGTVETESGVIQNELSKMQRQLEKMDNLKFVPLTLFMIDVNGLKLTIDAFGEQAGVEIMNRVESILKRECKADDYLAKISTDEFLLLLTKTDFAIAEKIAARLSSAISKERFNNIELSASIGFAIKENETDDLNEVFNRAEDEMYRRSIYESVQMKRKTIDIILDTLFERSKRELQHSTKVSRFSVALAKRMGFTDKMVNQIRLAGLMHDIGKIGVDIRILNKENFLGKEEWDEIRKHPEIGRKILNSVPEMADISEIVFEHHEKWNGTGYPRGIMGENISLQARIIAVVDAYAAMTSDWPFKKTFLPEAAIEEIESCSGSQFDPEVARLFVKMIKEELNL